MPRIASVACPRPILDDLWQHAQELSPQEACGMLLGTPGTNTVVHLSVRGVNMLDAPDRFLLDAASLLRADALAAEHGLAIVGFYHSHPQGQPIPSRTDRDQAWPDVITLIVGMTADAGRSTCAWTIDAGGIIHPVIIAVAKPC